MTKVSYANIFVLRGGSLRRLLKKNALWECEAVSEAASYAQFLASSEALRGGSTS